MKKVSIQQSAVSGQLSCFQPVWYLFYCPIKLWISFAFCLLPFSVIDDLTTQSQKLIAEC
ncbi:MAG: hypothetical protein F6K65_21110 [Moorea sp. SIO3C2]|nr:hypothetical protein [Moorena sp. SIO3C2]